MHMPICDLCLKSDILCGECSEKLEKKEISELDIKVARVLYKLVQKSIIPEINFKKALALNGFVLIISQDSIAPLIGKGGRVVRMISDQLGKKVRMISKGSVRSVIQDLVFPAKVYGVNVLYTKDGQKHSVIISKEDMSRLAMDLKTLERAIYALTKKEVEFNFR